jgi:hypothetical protein
MILISAGELLQGRRSAGETNHYQHSGRDRNRGRAIPRHHHTYAKYAQVDRPIATDHLHVYSAVVTATRRLIIYNGPPASV